MSVIKENGWECESPVDESKCANLSRFILLPRTIARSIRVASRIISLPCIYFATALRDHAYVDFYVAT